MAAACDDVADDSRRRGDVGGATGLGLMLMSAGCECRGLPGEIGFDSRGRQGDCLAAWLRLLAVEARDRRRGRVDLARRFLSVYCVDPG